MNINDKFIEYVEKFVTLNINISNYSIVQETLTKLDYRRKNLVINTDNDCENISNVIEKYFKDFINYKSFIGIFRKNKIKKILESNG